MQRIRRLLRVLVSLRIAERRIKQSCAQGQQSQGKALCIWPEQKLRANQDQMNSSVDVRNGGMPTQKARY